MTDVPISMCRRSKGAIAMGRLIGHELRPTASHGNRVTAWLVVHSAILLSTTFAR